MLQSYALPGPLEGRSGAGEVPNAMYPPLKHPRGVNPKVDANQRHGCTLCGKPYHPGETVLALASLYLGPSDTHQLIPQRGDDRSSDLILGHHDCVLPRLMALLANVQAGGRLVDDLMPG